MFARGSFLLTIETN